jgi:hypothetical protein
MRLSATGLSALGALAHSIARQLRSQLSATALSALGAFAHSIKRLSATVLSALGALAQALRGYRRLRSRLSPLCPDTLWHVALGPYGARRCGKMAMEYGAEPSYGQWAMAWGPWHMAFGRWPSTFDCLHRAIGLQNRVPLPIPAPGREVQRTIFDPFRAIWLPLGTDWSPQAAKERPKVDHKVPNRAK